MIGSRCFGFWWRGVFSALNKIATVVIRFCRSCDSSLVEWCRWEIASYWQSEHKAFFLLPSDTKHTNSPIPWSPSQQEFTALNTASSAITQQCHKDFFFKRHDVSFLFIYEMVFLVTFFAANVRLISLWRRIVSFTFCS